MKACFVGAGSIGMRHIKNLSDIYVNDGEVLKIDLLRSTNRELPSDISGLIDKEYRALNEIDVDYDFIFITNPTYLHYEYIDKLKHHAKAFFVEKPLISDFSQNIFDLDLPENNIYYVACPLRYTKVLLYAKEFFKSHKPYSVRAISSSYLPEWRKNIDYRNTYSAHRNQGGGVCIDLIHEWDYLYSFFGKPIEILQFSGKYSNLEIDSDDLAVYIARYNDFLIELHLDYFGRNTERKLEAFCEDGSYIFDIVQNKVFKDGNIVKSFEELPNDKYVAELRDFIALSRGEISNTNGLNHAMEVLRITMGKQVM